MPTYVYKCSDCEEVTEAIQKFTDEPLKICPLCEGELNKVFSAAPVVFKGPGFYSTGG